MAMNALHTYGQRGGALGFLLALASLLGGGIFFLPGVIDPLPLSWAVGIVLASTLVFAGTTVAFTSALNRYLDSDHVSDSPDFIGSMLEARLGRRPARVIAFLLVAQSILFLFGYVHEVSGRTALVLGVPALPVAALVALVIASQQRGRSTKASINSAQLLAAINTAILLTLLLLITLQVDFGLLKTGATTLDLSVGPAIIAMSFCFSLLYGHIGAATAVVAARERGISTRRVQVGVVLGVLSVGIVLSLTIVLHRSIAATADAPSFFLDRLELLGVPTLATFASLYLVGQLLLQALQTSLGITMLTRDWLTRRRPSSHPSIAAAPATMVVLLAGLGAQFSIGGYQTALALSGVLLVPVLGGCIPLLLCHEEPHRLLTALSPRSIITAFTIVFLAPTIGHGAIVWSGTLHRLLIGLTIVVVVAIMSESLAGPAVRERGGRVVPRRALT